MKRLDELAISYPPWKVSAADDTLVTTKEGGYRVAIGCCERYDGGVGNAQLIAAAPELYACLKHAIQEQCVDCRCCSKDDKYECDRSKIAWCFIWEWRDALAKAAGEEVKS